MARSPASFRLRQRPAREGYQSRVNAINAIEPELAALSDEALKARTTASSSPTAKHSTSWFRRSPRCARRPSAPSASAISTSS